MPISERRKWKTNRSDDEILKIVLANLAQTIGTTPEQPTDGGYSHIEGGD